MEKYLMQLNRGKFKCIHSQTKLVQNLFDFRIYVFHVAFVEYC